MENIRIVSPTPNTKHYMQKSENPPNSTQLLLKVPQNLQAGSFWLC